MTERTPQGLNVMLQSVRECRLTKNQVFRLWKCAVKDDDKLVDAVIEKLYEEMIAFDLARAETVMQLIIDRDEAAVPTFRDLLQDIATSDLPKTDQSRCHGASPTQHLQELGVPRELIRPIISINKTSDPIVPGFGFLRDVFRDPFIVHWELNRLEARSKDLPGIAVPMNAFMGTHDLGPHRHFRAHLDGRAAHLTAALGVVDIAGEQATAVNKAHGKSSVVPTTVSVSGLPLKPEGELPVFATYLGGQKIAPLANLSEDVSLAARNATLNMIDFLVKEKGLSREQAYVLTSVAVDLNIAQLVDIPNLGVTAILNRDIFVSQ